MNNMSMQQLHTCDVYYCTKLHPRRTYPGIVVVVAFIANRQRTKQWPMLQAIVLFLRHLFRLKPQSVRIIPGTNTYRHVVSFFFFSRGFHLLLLFCTQAMMAEYPVEHATNLPDPVPILSPGKCFRNI